SQASSEDRRAFLWVATIVPQRREPAWCAGWSLVPVELQRHHRVLRSEEVAAAVDSHVTGQDRGGAIGTGETHHRPDADAEGGEESSPPDPTADRACMHEELLSEG